MDTRVHISLEVSDLAKAVAFYTKLFQQEPTKLRGDYANFRMETPQLHLALVHTPGRKQEPGSGFGNNRHFGIELFTAEKLAGWLEAATAASLEPRIEENVTSCYATADKFWARDPDGHEWEFWVRREEAESMHGQPQTTTAKKMCCAPGQC